MERRRRKIISYPGVVDIEGAVRRILRDKLESGAHTGPYTTSHDWQILVSKEVEVNTTEEWSRSGEPEQ